MPPPSTEFLWDDLRSAVNALVRGKRFSAVVIATLSATIATSFVVFGIYQHIVAGDLPYPDSDRLVAVRRAAVVHRRTRISVSDEFRLPHFLSFGLYQSATVTIGSGASAKQVPGAVVDDEFFTVFGTNPILGRTFLSSEVGTSVALISERLWLRQLGRPRNLTNPELLINGRQFTVIGVMPGFFRFPDNAAIWIPPGVDRQVTPAGYMPAVVARLGTNTSVAEAAESLRVIEARRLRRPPRTPPLIPLQEAIQQDLKAGIALCAVFAALILVIGCTNVAGLWVTRIQQMRRALALRSALGGTSARLLFQVGLQTLILNLIAGVIGFTVGIGCVRWLEVLNPELLPNDSFLSARYRHLLFAGASSLLTSIICSAAVPVFMIRRASLSQSLLNGHVSLPLGRKSHKILVTIQVAVAALLLWGALTITETVIRLSRVDVGFSSRTAVFVDTLLPASRYSTAADIQRFLDDLSRQVSLLAGRSAVGVTNIPPGPARLLPATDLVPTESQADQPNQPRSAILATASEGYFTAAGIQILAGRSFSLSDAAGTPDVTILSESAARQIANNAFEIIGKQVTMGRGGKKIIAEVVGVVNDVRLHGPAYRPPPVAYRPLSQARYEGQCTLVVDMHQPPSIETIREALAATDPTLPLFGMRPVVEVSTEFMRIERAMQLVVSLFAVFAVALACMGVYNTAKQSISDRTWELALRLSLGADPARIRRQILTAHVLAGVMGTVMAALFAPPLFSAMLRLGPSIQRPTAASVICSVILILAATVAAARAPATAAANVNPAEVLRRLT